MAGYSTTPLVKKLGIKPAIRAIAINAPDHYFDLLGPLPEDLEFKQRCVGTFDFIHVFARRTGELQRRLKPLKAKLSVTGMMWLSWPKRTSPLALDLGEAQVRSLGLATGLVDIKICAVDDDWSGLKFVFRVKDRQGR